MSEGRKSNFIVGLAEIPAVRDYLNSIGAEPRSLLKAVVTEKEGGYRRDSATIKLDKVTGEIKVTPAAGIDPKPYLPSEEQQRRIAFDVARARFPEQKAVAAILKPPPMVRDAARDDVFEFRGADGNIIMLQVRRDEKGSKSYVPFYLLDRQYLADY